LFDFFFFWNIFMNSKKHKYLWNMTKRLMMTLSVMMNRQINSIGFCLTFIFYFLEDITMQCMVLWKNDNGGLTGQREREGGRERCYMESERVKGIPIKASYIVSRHMHENKLSCLATSTKTSAPTTSKRQTRVYGTMDSLCFCFF
jgi:hypothetical protein